MTREPVQSPEDARLLLCRLGDHLRDVVLAGRSDDMASVEGETVADTMYAIDLVADDAVLSWFERTGPTWRSSRKGSTSRWSSARPHSGP